MKGIETAVLLLKRHPRTGWVEAGVRKPESVADHSYSLAILAMLYADLKRLNRGKAVRMALLHDLAEAYTGDLTPRTKKKIKRDILENVERAVVYQLLSELPENVMKRYARLYDEYLSGRSAEARLVHQLDKLEMMNEAFLLRIEQGLKLSRFMFKKPKTFENIAGDG